jgi:LuxR family maltose regulon positive regulatory protein
MTQSGDSNIVRSILRTKILVPKRPSTLVNRDHLITRLNIMRDQPLILLNAAGGFGKTTIMSLWSDSLKAEGEKVAWVTLDENDGDVSQILQYIGMSLEASIPGVGIEMLSLLMPGAPSVSPRLLEHSLLNGLAATKEKVTLFIDDIHLSPCPGLSEMLEFLFVHAPEGFRLVLGTRKAPDFGLATLQARGLLAELNETDLRFTRPESDEFLKRIGRSDLNNSDLTALHSGAEGWAAGLQLASISLRAGQSALNVAERLAAPQGSVGLYLAEDTLAHQDPEIIDFLLRTSVVERLCPDLCNALTGREDGSTMLEKVRALNLFLSRYEDEPSWFRYHGLFRRFLMNRLQTEQPELLSDIHRRACGWLSSYGLTAEAVRHALACGDQELAADLVDNCAMGLLYRSDTALLQRLIDQLSPESVNARPGLRAAIAWGLSLRRDPQQASAIVDQLERDLGTFTEADQVAMIPRIGAIRATIALLSDDSVTAKKLALEWLKDAKSSEDWERAVVVNVLSLAQIDTSDFIGASQLHHETIDLPRQVYPAVYCDVIHGLGYRLQGRLHDAANRFRSALEYATTHAGPNSTAAILASTVLAEVCYEWNDLDQVRLLLQGRLDFIDDIGLVWAVIAAHVPLIRLMGFDRKAETLELIDRLEAWGRKRFGGQRVVAAALSERVRFNLGTGNRISAELAVNELRNLAPKTAPDGGLERDVWEASAIARARLDLFDGRGHSAIETLLPLIQETESLGRYGRSVLMRTLLVLAYDAIEDDEKALSALWDLMAIAGPPGFARTLLDEGPAFREFLEYASKIRVPHLSPSEQRRRHQSQTYLDRLLAFAPTEETRSDNDPLLYSILSIREIEVLSAVASGMSNKEVARTLALTPETVKWHMKSILAKLQAGNRNQAVRRAYNLGLRVT